MAVHITGVTSADAVGSIDDLLMLIFSHLPVKSLMRFKLVSKHWKSIITSHRFSLLRYPCPNHATGLICPSRKISEFEYIHLDVTNPTNPPFRKLSFPDDPFPFWIQQSCNGLLLCCSSGNRDRWFNRSPIRRCCVYNPTTNCFKKLPRPGVVNGLPRIVHGVNLAFDHAKSPLYKVVCVRGSEFACEPFQIEIYSSESGVWRVSGEPFTAFASFDHGVYWNSTIHWIIHQNEELLYFNVDKERFGKVPLPAKLGYEGRSISYFGESCDHLYIIESSQADGDRAFDVYEMKRDYSEWFVKYRVDLSTVAAAFPRMVYMVPLTNRTSYDYLSLEYMVPLTNRNGYRFWLLSLIGDDDKGSFLVLQISSKFIRFNLDCNTFDMISDVGDAVVEFCVPRSFEHIESLACV